MKTLIQSETRVVITNDNGISRHTSANDHWEWAERATSVKKRVRWAARQLLGSNLFACYELPDLEQELWIDLWQRLPQYDPARSALPTFVDRLVTHKQVNLIEARAAQKRRLERPIGRISWDDLEEWNEDDGDLDKLSVQPLERTDEQMDSEWIMNRLSPEDRELLETLASHSKTEAAHRLGISRATLYRELTRIRYRVERMLRETLTVKLR